MRRPRPNAGGGGGCLAKRKKYFILIVQYSKDPPYPNLLLKIRKSERRNFSEEYSEFGARAFTQGCQTYGEKIKFFGCRWQAKHHGYTALSMYRVMFKLRRRYPQSDNFVYLNESEAAADGMKGYGG
jgi:hypothetical protein